MPIKKRLPEYMKLKKMLNVAITENQKKELKRKAKAEDVSISDYVRSVLFPE